MKFTNYSESEDRQESERKIIELYQELKSNIFFTLDNNLNKDLIKEYINNFEKELLQRGCIEE